MRPCLDLLLVSGTVLLSLDMLYPQIISHCIDDDMMTFDFESVFGSSVGIRYCIVIFGYVVATDNISLHRR